MVFLKASSHENKKKSVEENGKDFLLFITEKSEGI